MNETKTAVKPDSLGSTARSDAWWIEPAAVGLGFAVFIAYSTYRALMGTDYEWGPYLSPFYSPKISLSWFSLSPAFLILWIPAGFRATCYYYRKAYYRAYFLDPPACAVGHLGGSKYVGENAFPYVLQNLHRYFLYLAIIVIGFLWYDAIVAFNWDGSFGVGVGSLIMLANVVLLSNYTFGCHAFRHLVGGKLDCFSCSSSAKSRYKIWEWVSKLNEHHMFWAWLSLFSVGFTDFYIWMVASGTVQDLRLF